MKKETKKRFILEDFLGQGWYCVESNESESWAWSSKEAYLCFPDGHSGLYLEFSCSSGQFLKLQVEGAGESLSIKGSGQPFEVFVPAGVISLKINIEDPWVPKQVFGSSDERSLGICLQGIYSSATSRIKSSHPHSLQLGLSGVCNINPPCVMCFARNLYIDLQQKFLPKPVISKLSPYFSFAERVVLHGGQGEPLLFSGLTDLINKINKQGSFVTFATNGLLLTQELSKKLILAGLKGINFSLDASTAKTYKKIRNNDGFYKVVDNIKKLLELKNSLGSDYPLVLMHMVIMKENIHELVGFIELADRLGIDAVQITLMAYREENYKVETDNFTFDYFQQKVDLLSGKFRETMILAREKAQACGIKILSDSPEIISLIYGVTDNSSHLKSKNIIRFAFSPDAKNFNAAFFQNPVCSLPWKSAHINSQGDMKFCCYSKEVLGNLINSSFEKVWNGVKAQKIRKCLLENEIPAGCRSCPVTLPK